MATPEEILALFEQNRGNGVLVNAAPLTALAIGYQDIEARGAQLETTSYKYVILFKREATGDDEPDHGVSAAVPWSALRIECDGRVGHNSWLLNHPVHHAHLGTLEELRLPLAVGRSLVAFVDLCLRAFAESAWAELYPDLYLHLSAADGLFTSVVAPGPEARLSAASHRHLERVLLAARTERPRWYLDLEQWRADVGGRDVAYAPELYDTLRGP